MNRKRQIIEAMLAELYEIQEEMIEAALEQSDLSDAKTVIDFIMEKQ
jgi:hypothetical protein